MRAAAVAELDPEALRGQHDRVAHHVEQVIARGQRAGDFRTDLPGRWLVTIVFATLHAAADEVSAGRLDAQVASDVLVATLLSILPAVRILSLTSIQLEVSGWGRSHRMGRSGRCA